METESKIQKIETERHRLIAELRKLLKRACEGDRGHGRRARTCREVLRIYPPMP